MYSVLHELVKTGSSDLLGTIRWSVLRYLRKEFTVCLYNGFYLDRPYAYVMDLLRQTVNRLNSRFEVLRNG